MNLSCAECIKLHTKRRRDTPCNIPEQGCPKPFLDPGNEDAWVLYSLISEDPRIVGMGAFTGANTNQLRDICNAYGIPESEYRFYLDKMLVLNQVSREIWRREEESRRAHEENKRKAESMRSRRG